MMYEPYSYMIQGYIYVEQLSRRVFYFDWSGVILDIMIVKDKYVVYIYVYCRDFQA